MTAALIFLDTETTGLHPYDDDIWEVAAIRRDPDGQTYERHWFVQHDTDKATRMPESFISDHRERYDPDAALTPRDLVAELEMLFLGAPGDPRAHIVGAVPSFDAQRLERLFLAHGIDVPWHYHLIDIETLAIGVLIGAYDAEAIAGLRPNRRRFDGPPWDSERLSRAVRVDPDQFARHTAMGDVRWALAIWDRVMTP